MILAVIIGSFMGYKYRNNSVISRFLLMFSAGLLLSIIVLELFPGIYNNNSVLHFNAGIWVMIGVGIQMFLESLSKGIEHGHLHKDEHHHSVVPFSVFIGLFIHSFLDGIPVQAAEHYHLDSHLIWAISIHKIPEALVLSSFLFSSKLSKSLTFVILILFTFSAPLGALAGTLFDEQIYLKATGIVAGIFLHISSEAG